MAENEAGIASIASEFANISSRAVSAGNRRRLDVARGNIEAAEGQIELEETTQRREIARELAVFQGSQSASRAFRGGGTTGTATRVADAATAQAADQAALAEANAAARRVSVAAANQVMLDDPVAAAIEGGLQGLSIGTQIAQSLMEQAEVTEKQRSRLVEGTGTGGPTAIPVFRNTITSTLNTPGFDPNQFLTGVDLGV